MVIGTCGKMVSGRGNRQVINKFMDESDGNVLLREARFAIVVMQGSSYSQPLLRSGLTNKPSTRRRLGPSPVGGFFMTAENRVIHKPSGRQKDGPIRQVNAESSVGSFRPDSSRRLIGVMAWSTPRSGIRSDVERPNNLALVLVLRLVLSRSLFAFLSCRAGLWARSAAFLGRINFSLLYLWLVRSGFRAAGNSNDQCQEHQTRENRSERTHHFLLPYPIGGQSVSGLARRLSA